MTLLTYSILGVVVLLVLSQTIKILKEYERGVVFLLGRFQTVKGPGLIILIPGIQKMTRVDLRVMVLDVPTQDVISRDNVSVKVNAVIYFRVVNPEHAIIRVANFFEATTTSRCCSISARTTGASRSPMSRSSMSISTRA
jgi:regulator of protease activity HflC (stomatin/prohibitin superfamily)